ncbi:hypothetical protein RvY_18653 [Ramazzottius varieornatus]|uniref:Uncharacterized protein n=1 Tax=Ramazzottius varieornatus TaxID=947166 RepID=A0A1D1W814_RAMVA|nr:hypothetical protein RvY_18653 [Ramazzottius varieornatus]
MAIFSLPLFILLAVPYFVRGQFFPGFRPKCPNGYPVVDEKEVEISCLEGLNRQCPEGTHCLLVPDGSWAVCCSRDPPIDFPPRDDRCELGQPARDPCGDFIRCPPASDGRHCPNGYQCNPNTKYSEPLCCPVEKDEPELCPVGRPARDEKGEQYKCGKSPIHRECPEGTRCHVSDVDAYAVCCQEIKCRNGETPTDETGEPYFCGSSNCPEGTECQRSSDGLYTVCRKRDREPVKCPVGDPVTSENGEQLICRNNAMSARVCPRGTRCIDSPDGTYGMCCKLDIVRPPRCDIGEPVRDENGQEYFCGRGPGYRKCPYGTVCHISPIDAYAVCCQSEERKCGNAEPALDENGLQYRCGRGRQCPEGTECQHNEYDGGICCKPKEPRVCPIGKPLTDNNGDPYRCSTRENSRGCPWGSFCVALDLFGTKCSGVCCPYDKPARRCPSGYPQTDEKGVELFCGRGPCHHDCPRGSVCNILPWDGSAVCCPEKMKLIDIGVADAAQAKAARRT